MNISCVIVDYSELRGRIKTKIGTEGEFAKKIGRTPQFVSKVFHNKAYFEYVDMVKIKELLDIADDQVTVFFFTYKVHKCELVS